MKAYPATPAKAGAALFAKAASVARSTLFGKGRGAPAPFLALLSFALALSFGCASKEPARPNVLWILWDTVRADRLGLYGHTQPTTPFLDAWARDARVYDDCLSPANYTVPAHASFFTGLLSSQHRATNDRLYLDENLTTIAELLRDAGYQTYLYSANPNISAEENFDQGFTQVEHPWDDKHRRAALDLIREKLDPTDRSSGLPEKIRRGQYGKWDIKASGPIAQQALVEWLKRRNPDRPYFAFLNYMEAHRPYIPPRSYRERMMSPAQVARSYEIDRSWASQWSFTFGLADYDAEELAITAATYDAAIAELDDLLRDLLQGLEKAGDLENTIVVITSDHGEHLGDHHMLGHQHSLYNGLIRVPLIIRYPRAFPAGRDPRPVMTHDLFPTLLALAGVAVPPSLGGGAVDLTRAPETRTRVSECLGIFRDPFAAVAQAHPGWQPTAWERELRAIVEGPDKLIWSSNGRHELYDYLGDPAEQRNLAAEQASDVARLTGLLNERLAGIEKPAAAGDLPPMSPEHRERLRSLGYIDPSAPADTAAQTKRK
ncbi:MAG: sulfatase [Candidatus Eisenbacteria bacterium]|nr:sulfatase [Candidatus Eisenbacteria bacterium]